MSGHRSSDESHPGPAPQLNDSVLQQSYINSVTPPYHMDSGATINADTASPTMASPQVFIARSVNGGQGGHGERITSSTTPADPLHFVYPLRQIGLQYVQPTMAPPRVNNPLQAAMAAGSVIQQSPGVMRGNPATPNGQLPATAYLQWPTASTALLNSPLQHSQNYAQQPTPNLQLLLQQPSTSRLLAAQPSAPAAQWLTSPGELKACDCHQLREQLIREMWTKESFKSQLAQSAIAHSAELQRQREALEAQLDEDRHAMEAKVEGMRSEIEGRLKAVEAEKREGDAELARAKAEVWGMRRKDTEAQERIKAAEDAIKEAEKRLEERELASGKEIDALLEGKWRAVRSIEEKVAKISDLEGTVSLANAKTLTLESDCGELRCQLEAEKGELAAKSMELYSLRAEFNCAKVEFREAARRVGQCHADEMEELELKFKEELSAVQAQYNELKEDNGLLTAQLHTAHEELDLLRSNEEKAQLRIAELDLKLEVAREENQGSVKEQTRLAKEILCLQGEVDELRERKEGVESVMREQAKLFREAADRMEGVLDARALTSSTPTSQQPPTTGIGSSVKSESTNAPDDVPSKNTRSQRTSSSTTKRVRRSGRDGTGVDTAGKKKRRET